jgi:hypothetical protein
MAASFSGVSPGIIKLLQDLAGGGGVPPFVSGGGFNRFASTINQLHSFAGGDKTQANVEQGLTSRPATPVGHGTASADEPMMSAAMPPPTGNPLSAIGQIMPLLKAGRGAPSYDQEREQHDRAELLGQYRSCIDAGRGDCDRITAGLNPIALTIHQPAGMSMSVTGSVAPAVAAAAPRAAGPIAAAPVESPSPPGIEAYLRNQLTPFADQAAAIRAASSAPVTLHSILAGLGL